MQLLNKGKDMLKSVKTYWKQPPQGKYMTFREIFAYSIGGIGAYSIFTMAQALLLSTTNVIIGNTIGIQPMHMYVMYLISVITNIPLTMVRANMVDNVKYKSGKYRPYLLRMGIPTVAISMLFVFTPYAKFDYLVRCVLIFIYNFGLQFFYNFFYDAYENLIHVLSPDTQERTNVTAIKSMIYSL
ncbi:MAG: MFS transporter, partial [Clostridia bacterium]|nr:MFS transporter [Clostridia bacterium]